jgi:hypothetical protein
MTLTRAAWGGVVKWLAGQETGWLKEEGWRTTWAVDGCLGHNQSGSREGIRLFWDSG